MTTVIGASLTRQDIADALDAVDGVTGVPVPPAHLAPFVAWPAWQSTTWVNDCARDVTWFVFVALPAPGNGAAIEAGDPLIEAVGDALWMLGRVVIVQPVRVTTGTPGDDTPALRFQLLAS